jgi:hypothetical protein
MDIRILEFGFFMAAITEVRHLPYEFNPAFLLRMLLVLNFTMAGIASYAKSSMVIF